MSTTKTACPKNTAVPQEQQYRSKNLVAALVFNMSSKICFVPGQKHRIEELA
jgi:hypothetical protein